SQKEFYQVFAFFNNLNERGVYWEKRGNEPPLISFARPEHEKRLRQHDAAIEAAEMEFCEAEAASPADKSAKEELSKKLVKLRKEKEEYESIIPSVMVMQELPRARDTYLLKRGRYDMPDQRRKLEAAVPAVLPPLPGQAPRNRLGLARWLVG